MEKCAEIASVQYKGGLVDFNRVSLIEQNLVNQQNLLAEARGNTTLGLVNLYRALGGGWEIRLNQPSATSINTSPEPISVPLKIESSDLVPPPVPPPAASKE